MLSPTPFSLCCTLLLCLPIALFLSTTTTITITKATVSNNTNDNRSQSNNTCNDHSKNPKMTLYRIPTSTYKNPTFAALHLPKDDDKLFRLAAGTNPKPKSTKKIAFMFLTTTPLPFAPLWHLFFHPNNTPPNPPKTNQKLFNIYIHADPNHRYEPPFSGLFAARTIPSKPTRRSDPSLIAAARRLLAHALLHDSSNAMFALLSPSCIPLHSFPFIYNMLATHSTKSFIEILRNEPGLRERYDARGVGAMLPEVPFESFRVGSQFFVLTRRHARLVVRDTRLWAKFRLPCGTPDTCYAEEHYFPTLLSTLDSRTCVPATLTHVDWTDSVDGHPRTYREAEVQPKLIHELRNASLRYGDWNGSRDYPFLFARKFAPECLEPLMRIAGDVIFRD